MQRPDTAGESGAGRHLHAQWIDRTLPFTWKSTCTSTHGGLCKELPGALSSIRPTWLVDVKYQCLVATPANGPYVALSYVWGTQVTLNTTRSNLDSLQRRGSLSGSLATPIAKTIRDAMAVVVLMSERYLWVDTLCIVQDDASQKHSEMSNMALIYANASVTILAIQGDHANSGLPGFCGISEPRHLLQNIHTLDEETNVILSPVDTALYEVGIDNPVWASRGWTFQEHFFSRKRLIFDGNSIRWECASATWRESVELPSHLDRTHQVIGCESILQPKLPNLGGIGKIIYDYNQRQFSYPEDCLNGFAGISLASVPN